MLPVVWPQPLTRLPPLGCSTCPAIRARPPRAGRGGPWDVLAKGGHLLGRHGRRDQRGPDRAGSDGVDPDPLADQLLGQAAGEGNDRALGRGVVNQARVALVGGDRGRVHHRRARTPMGQGRLGQEKHPQDVGPEVRSSHRLLAEGLVADVAGRVRQQRPSAWTSLTVWLASVASSARCPMATSAPSQANSTATARPMPLSPPLIRAICRPAAGPLPAGAGGRLGGHLLLDPGLCLALGRPQPFLILLGHAGSIRYGRGGR